MTSNSLQTMTSNSLQNLVAASMGCSVSCEAITATSVKSDSRGIDDLNRHATAHPLRGRRSGVTVSGGPGNQRPRSHEGVHRTGDWMLGPDGKPCRGSLGVLADDVLGYAVVAERPVGHWAVSTEIFVDFCSVLPVDGAILAPRVMRSSST